MIVQVTGASTRNKGAELMLAAVRDHFRVPDSDVTLAVTPWFGSVRDRLKYNLAQKLEWNRWGRTRLGMRMTSGAFRRSLGMYEDADLDAVIDISGFAFGDQHPPHRTVQFARRVDDWKAQNKKVVLLPQAFGPFENSVIRTAFGRLVDRCDLICVRDQTSFDHITGHFGQRENLMQCPDITIGMLSGHETRSAASGVLVVPNTRMVDKADTAKAKRYIPLLQSCIRTAQGASHAVRLLLHDAIEDQKLVPRIQSGLERRVEVIEESNPLVLQQIISRSVLLIGSRFHALVSALSSGVPVLVTGWSHKYEMLLKDFGCPDSVVDPAEADDVLREKVQLHLKAEFQESMRKKLLPTRTSMVATIEKMWQRVDAIIGWESPCA